MFEIYKAVREYKKLLKAEEKKRKTLLKNPDIDYIKKMIEGTPVKITIKLPSNETYRLRGDRNENAETN